MIRYRSLFAALALAACTWSVSADVLWDMRAPAAPVQMGPTQTVKVGTVQGAWPNMLTFFGRPALCDAGYRIEYRTAATAPNGWQQPVVGVDGNGVCAAVREPLPPAIPVPTDPLSHEAAMAALAEGIEAEFERRAEAVSGGMAEQVYRTQRVTTLLAAIQADTATAADRAELAALLEVQRQVQALRAYAWLPTVPEMWGPAPTDLSQSLYYWAAAATLTADQVAAISPASPPTAAPQWPVSD